MKSGFDRLMSKRTNWALFLLLAAAFLWIHHDAYKGYFQDDEINAMAWTRWKPLTVYLRGFLVPLYRDYFRAVGFTYFHITEALFGMDFPKYVAVIQAIHLLNVWMLWLLLRRLGSPYLAACVAVAFFALHMALLDVVWKPMFVFDLLCGTFCLASLVLWTQGHWILSFAAFWLGFQAKELAVMVPFVLIAYELWFGARRWLYLAPFVAASLSFGVQALILTPPPSEGYTYHFTPGALAKTGAFYADRIFLVPYAGFLLPVGVALARNRRAWFGLVTLCLFFAPLLFLPGRIFSAYCYVPFIGLAVAIGGMAEKVKPAVLALLVLLFIRPELHALRTQRREIFRLNRDIRTYITSVEEFVKVRPGLSRFAYDGLPEGFQPFGVEGAVKYFLYKLDVDIVPLKSPEGTAMQQAGNMAILRWDDGTHQLHGETR